MKSTKGFSLIELMITVAIIAVLSMIAYPSFMEQIRKGKRSEGAQALLRTAQDMERFFTANGSYPDNLTDIRASYPTFSGDSPSKAAYNIALAGLLPAGCGPGTATRCMQYTLQANPTFTDAKCGQLTLNEAGVKTENGTAASASDCW